MRRMPEHRSILVPDTTEARVRTTRQFYQGAVAAYLGARTEGDRSILGEAMYFAQMATIEARFNPEGCAHFRALAESKMAGGTSEPSGVVSILTKAPRSGSPRARRPVVPSPDSADAHDVPHAA
jgi:hypothetical protein